MLRQEHAALAAADHGAEIRHRAVAHVAIEELPVGAVETDEEDAGRLRLLGRARATQKEPENEKMLYRSFHKERSASRTRSRPLRIASGDTAPAERRNQPVSRLSPKAWNATTAKPA